MALRGTIPAGIDAGQRGRAFAVHDDAAALQLQRLLSTLDDRVRQERLTDRLEHHIGRQAETVAGAGKPTLGIELGVFEFYLVHLALRAADTQRAGPMLDLDAIYL